MLNFGGVVITMILRLRIDLKLGGGNSNIFIPIPGEMIQFDEHLVQMGRNHQLVSLRIQFHWKITN